jgi:transposase
VVQRAQIALLACKGVSTEVIATKVGCSSRNVRVWKARLRQNPSLDALQDKPRAGRPSSVPLEVRCELIRLACERPEGEDAPAPFRDVWTQQALADALEERTSYRLSKSEVGRILRFENLRPHRVKIWLKSQDPEFQPKAERICNLYLKPPEAATVVCVDEKPLQVLERVRSTHRATDGSVRYEFEYRRHGTQSLLAAFDIRTGRVFGRVVKKRSAKRLVSFMNQLARRYPTGDVYVVWDNLNTHHDGRDRRWTRFNEQHGGRFHFVYTPKHASWLNQVEIWFSILQRRILRYGDFETPDAQKDRVEGFIRHWNRRERHPFRWTWRSNPRKNRTSKRR